MSSFTQNGMELLALQHDVSWGKPVYRVWGKTFYRQLFWSSMQTNARLYQFENAGKSLFFGVFSMPTEKDLGGISSVKVSFSMRLRMAQLA